MAKNSKIKGLYEYFEAEDAGMNIPPIEKLTAYIDFNSVYAPPATKRNYAIFRMRRIALIAACLALILLSSVIMPAIVNKDITVDRFFDVEYTSGVAGWYIPGKMYADLLSLGAKRNSISQMSHTIHPLSNTIQGELPEWIYGVDTLNDRYLRLYAYDKQAAAAGYNGYLLYDIQKAEMVNLTSRIYDYLDEHPSVEPARVIQNIRFGEFGEYCIFDYYNADAYERYIINIETGEFEKLPRRDILAVSQDGKWIVNCTEVSGEFTVLLYEVSSGREAAIPVGYRGYTVFSDDGRSIIFYAPQVVSGEDAGWDTVRAQWKLYDIDSGSLLKGSGNIIRFTERGDALVVNTPEGGKILKRSDLTDVTEEYELKLYEKYAIVKRLDNGIYSFYATPLFGGNEILIADNIEAWTEWGGYYYIRRYGSENIVVYSMRDNKAFEYDISDLDIPRDYNTISIYVTDKGQKCRIVTYTDPGNMVF